MLENFKKTLEEKQKIVQLTGIIVLFSILFSTFFANHSNFFKADLLNIFTTESSSGGDGFDIFMGNYEDVESEDGSIRFFAGKDLKNIQMINFVLSYDSSEIFIKQDLESLSFNDFYGFDFQDILVEQDLGKAKITLMSSSPVNIPSGTAFLKVSTQIKKIPTNSKISIKVENIQFVNDSMKFFAGIGKKGEIKIGNLTLGNNPNPSFLSISRNYCEIGVECEIKFFGKNIENFSGSIAGIKQSFDSENKISFDFTGKNEGLYDVFISSGNSILKLENAIYLAKSENIGGNLNSEIVVLSDESYSSPAKVLNNNSMTVDLWAQVDSPNGVNLINKVSANLSVLGGSPVAQMKKETIVNNKVWFSLKGVKVSQTTAIGNQKIAITAEDTEGNTSFGEIFVNVTNDLMTSAAPELSGESVIYDRASGQIEVFVKVTDNDGIHDISSVNVDLTSLGLGYRELYSLSSISENSNLSPENQTNQNFGVIENGTNGMSSEAVISNSSIFDGRIEKKSEIFRLQSAISLPSDIKIGNYNIIFSAYDKSGSEASLIYNYPHKSGSAPKFVRKIDNVDDDYDMHYVRLNRWKIPNDGVTSFDISTIVQDDDGAGDIIEVRADLTGLGGDVVQLERQGEVLDSVNVKSSIFNLKGITVTPETRVGWHEFQLVAYDKQGNETAQTVQIQVLDPSSGAFANSKDTIKINEEKAYNEPNLAINDGKTTFTMNVFVENQGHEIEDVILNFGNLAKYIGGEENSSSENCKNQNERIVCMKHSVREGSKGQWFRLDNVIIPESTKPSVERYRVKTIAIQKGGRSVEGFSYITVSDGTLPEEGLGSPKLQMAISLSENQVQAVFTNPLNRDNIRKTNFKIVNTNDDTDHISIKDLKINTDSTIVTIETGDQESGKKYTLIADTEKLGLKEDSYTDNHKIFYGFDKEKIAPQLRNLEVLSNTKIAITFDQGIMPSSLEQKGQNFEIFEKTNPSKTLKVLTKEFSSDNNKTIYISTEKQAMNKNYVIIIKNIESASGVRFGDLKEDLKYSKGKYFGITKEFVGYNDVEKLHASARTKSLFELSNAVEDDCIDFRDFTMFSKDYKNGVPSSEYFDYNFDNIINFLDFTIFSKQYGKCEEKKVEKVEVNKVGTGINLNGTGNLLENNAGLNLMESEMDFSE